MGIRRDAARRGTCPRRTTRRDLVTALAERAAVALGHARVYNELRERADLLDTE